MGVSKNDGTPKSSNLLGFSIINHPFWGTPIFGNIHIASPIKLYQFIYFFMEYSSPLVSHRISIRLVKISFRASGAMIW